MMDDWQAWKDRIWESMEARFGYPGLAPLEQYMIRSRKEKRCIECGDPGTVEQKSVLVASVDRYWMCVECDEWWEKKRAV
jgi:hypothetical protein